LEQETASFAPLSPKHRRGAPVGNTNALKHGLYSTHHNAAGLLRVLSMASTSLTNMLKARFLIFGNESQPALSSALQAVLVDMRAKTKRVLAPVD